MSITLENTYPKANCEEWFDFRPRNTSSVFNILTRFNRLIYMSRVLLLSLSLSLFFCCEFCALTKASAWISQTAAWFLLSRGRLCSRLSQRQIVSSKERPLFVKKSTIWKFVSIRFLRCMSYRERGHVWKNASIRIYRVGTRAWTWKFHWEQRQIRWNYCHRVIKHPNCRLNFLHCRTISAKIDADEPYRTIFRVQSRR